MNKSRLAFVLAIVAAAMLLATTYLALLYAPIPQTSVRAAGEILPSIDGLQIRVAGFVCDIIRVEELIVTDRPLVMDFSVADFTDYMRYLAASAEDRLDEQWWTIRPIDVRSVSGGWAGGPSVIGEISLGRNLSVVALVVESGIGPSSNTTGYYLFSDDGEDFVFSASAGQFSLLNAPLAQKIFYFHMPAAWVSYLAFFTAMIFGALYLRTRDVKYDRVASSAAELGVLFATIAIATGPIWAKEEWGVYWRWDDTKLVTTFVLWLVYIGYLALRTSIVDPQKRARLAGVYGIVGFVTVPMSLLSSRIAPLLRSSHPQVIASSSGSLSPEAGLAVGVALVAFTVLFMAMLIKAVEIAESRDELEELKRTIGGED